MPKIHTHRQPQYITDILVDPWNPYGVYLFTKSVMENATVLNKKPFDIAAVYSCSGEKRVTILHYESIEYLHLLDLASMMETATFHFYETPDTGLADWRDHIQEMQRKVGEPFTFVLHAEDGFIDNQCQSDRYIASLNERLLVRDALQQGDII